MKNEWVMQIKRNSEVLKMLIGNLTEDQMNIPLKNSNSIAWIVGHIALYRGVILELIDHSTSIESWEQTVQRGANKKPLHIGKDDLLDVFNKRGANLLKWIPQMNDELLNKKTGKSLPDGSDDVKGTLSFMLFHETFHLGQIDLILAGHSIGGIP